jgi:hypothetical protein
MKIIYHGNFATRALAQERRKAVRMIFFSRESETVDGEEEKSSPDGLNALCCACIQD